MGGNVYSLQGTAPSTPPAGYDVLYFKSDGLMYFKSDGGTEYKVAYQGGAGFINVLSGVSGTNTITATGNPTIASYVAAMYFTFVPANANTGATTMNIDGLGAKNILKRSTSGLVALVADDLQVGIEYIIIYDGTQFQLVNSLPEQVAAASQAQQETGTSTVVYVSPGRQQYHPSAAKAWLRMSTSGGTPTLGQAYNVTSLTDNGAGDFTANFTVSFSAGTAYMLIGTSQLAVPNVNTPREVMAHTFNAGSCRFTTDNGAGSAEDNQAYTSVAFFGDQ